MSIEGDRLTLFKYTPTADPGEGYAMVGVDPTSDRLFVKDENGDTHNYSRVEMGIDGVQMWKKTYLTKYTGILEVWDRDITVRLDQTSPFEENFDFVFPQPFKEGTIPNVRCQCTYRTSADFTRWRVRLARETGLPDINEGGSSNTHEKARVIFEMTTSPGSAQYSVLNFYAIGEFDDTPE